MKDLKLRFDREKPVLYAEGCLKYKFFGATKKKNCKKGMWKRVEIDLRKQSDREKMVDMDFRAISSLRFK